MEQDILITPEVEEQSIEVIAEQGYFPKGTIDITSNGTVDVQSYATANVNVEMNLQSKDILITENGNTTIEPDQSYDGLSSVNINTSVPAPKYAPKFISFYYYNGNNLDYETANLDTSNITNMQNMFYSCTGLSSLNCSGFNTSNVTTMNSMFSGCRYITSINVDNFDTSKVEDMNNMFNNCFGWRTEADLDLSSFTLKNNVRMASMFRGCIQLRTLDISNMDFRNVTGNYGYIFSNCGTSTTTKLTTVYVKDEYAQQWILNLSSTDRPSTWSTDNVIIKS
jgi:surface protein